jgi:flagella basal body P-ring formation protein FlgA
MRVFVFLAGFLFAGAACADVVVATRTIRSHTIIAPGDIAVKSATIPGALENAADVIGLEARVVLYAGRPVRLSDIGAPALVERNGIVRLVFVRGALRISTEGRALGRGGVGDLIRGMNLSSRTTVTGMLGADGVVTVGH